MDWIEFLALCLANGYTHPTRLKNGKLAAINVRTYNTQILVDIDFAGYSDAF